MPVLRKPDPAGREALLHSGREKMRITIGSDHAGFDLKKVLIDHLRQSGHQVLDVGTHSTAPVDYPAFAEAVSLSLLRGECDLGILSCGNGVCSPVAPNTIPVIR